MRQVQLGASKEKVSGLETFDPDAMTFQPVRVHSHMVVSVCSLALPGFNFTRVQLSSTT